MSNGSKKQVITAFVIIMCISLLATLAVVIHKSYTNSYKLSDVSNLVVDYDPYGFVDIKGSLAITDEFGKQIDSEDSSEAYNYMSFSVRNDGSKKTNYSICLSKKKVTGSSIKNNYIKLFLTDESGNELNKYSKNRIPLFSDLLVKKNYPNVLVLYDDSIETGKEKKYVLRTWVSDSYVVGKEEENFSFEVSICGR